MVPFVDSVFLTVLLKRPSVLELSDCYADALLKRVPVCPLHVQQVKSDTGQPPHLRRSHLASHADKFCPSLF